MESSENESKNDLVIKVKKVIVEERYYKDKNQVGLRKYQKGKLG